MKRIILMELLLVTLISGLLGQETLGSAYLSGISRIRVADNYPVHPEANPSAYAITGNTITVEAWVFPTSLPGEANSHMTIVRRPYYNAEPWQAYELMIVNEDGNTPHFQFVISDGTVPVNAAVVRDDNEVFAGNWYHLSGTYDGSMVRLYVDGNEVNETAFSDNIGAGDTGFYVGGLADNFFQGLIDEVRLWNVGRSQADIQADMSSSLNGDEAGLVGYWPLDAFYIVDYTPVTADLTANHNDLWVQRGAEIIDLAVGDEVNIAPSHTFISLEGVIGETLEYTFDVASGWPLPTVSLVSGPAGMSIDSETSLLSWTPVDGQRGYHEFIYELENTAGSESGPSNIWVEAVPNETVTHDISNAGLTFSNNGVMGFYNLWEDNIGFTFNGVNGLYAGNMAVAISEEQVSGGLYVEEFGRLGSIDLIDSDFEDFDQAYRTSYDDARANNPIGISIIQRTHAKSSSPDEDYVIVEYEITNSSDANLNGVYVSLSMDWDIGEAVNNLGGYDDDLQLSYIYEADVAGNPYYYGVVALSDLVSGHTLNTGGGGDNYEMYEAMTNFMDLPGEPDDLRSMVACGPFDIAPDENVVVSYAVLGGTDLNDLNQNAEFARAVGAVSVSSNEIVPLDYFLRPNYPNPFNPITTIKYELPEQSTIKLAIYDIRGQEVITLVDGTKPAGYFEIQWNGVNRLGHQMSTGVYFCRLETGAYSKTIKLVYLQ
ncbi:MAG: T9SS type A sorting domain-containing protein [Candidatus Marinimicrobia bacterium]|nr:T9SS type A sorting domain-containing protein [Candidatus Neomarinimicrobiota bacterium]MBT4129179.1 T9SS type A sorting domain-containing protein [Candidatus Neomarinimicrobiota bacterium]MBT4295190.1 T9SS type A sorting domain-containing protein [Candidatus Neomarinimicrobiota bacterium]MBT4991902.1 T9SS type A sorting domain-containing protein [Candidatus Neomarinimicrobiota bacterium]MBT6001483.1 T9SS type A sorting domain-containing protein [Candidatus Neomarinimicrobiota bacterium]